MKKNKAFLMALFLSAGFTLAACGSSQNASAESAESNSVIEETETISEENEEYAIGETFGTDNVECILKEVQWVTPENFESITKYEKTRSGEHYYTVDTDTLYPDVKSSFGAIGAVESKIPEVYILLANFSLQNVGKEAVDPTYEANGNGGFRIKPYGTFSIIYDDGYTFDVGEDSGFTIGLTVLGDAVETLGGCSVPKQVYENEDKPLKVKVTLPNSTGEIEEFIVSVR